MILAMKALRANANVFCHPRDILTSARGRKGLDLRPGEVMPRAKKEVVAIECNHGWVVNPWGVGKTGYTHKYRCIHCGKMSMPITTNNYWNHRGVVEVLQPGVDF
eukprot:g3828.t1